MKITEVEKYQYLSVAFAVIAIVLAVLLIRAKNPTVTEGFEIASQALQNCSDGIKAWTEKYPAGTTPSVQSHSELVIVLQSCGAKAE